MKTNLKKYLFWGVTLLFPIVLLSMIEVGFRLSSYHSQNRDLFIEYQVNPDYLIVNPDYVTRYFPGFEPQIAPNPFRKVKTDSTFRVFVFGGSSAQGFPFNFYYSFAAQLEQKILLNTLGLNVEVINLGMTAVNSYVINDLSKYVKDLQPDAIIIYAGHNEYYGSFGVGSTQFNIGNNIKVKRLILWLKNFLLYQFIEDVLASKVDETATQRTLMARVVSESSIKKDEEIFNAGIAQFEANIGSVISRFQRHSIPVFIGTVASNIKDQAPFSSYWEAMNAYDLGDQFLAVGDTARAKIEFAKAKEFDTIRFRAPDAINQTIKNFSEQEHVILVDIEKLLNEFSLSGIADNSLFIDHLHPTEIGHGLMADLYFESFLDLGLIVDNYKSSSLNTPLVLSDFENAYSTAPILRLLSGYPFVKGLDADEELIAFQESYRYLLKKSFADSIGATTWFNSDIVALNLQKVIEEAKNNDDSLLVAQANYELFHWLPFNENLVNQIVEYHADNRKLDVYTLNILLKGTNNGISDPILFNKISEIYRLNEEDEKANFWNSKANN